MRRLFRLVLLLTAALLAPSSAYAERSEAPAPILSCSEGCLKRLVSTHFESEPLQAALDRVSSGAHCRLKATRHLAIRGVSLMVRDIPIEELMRLIAELWSLPRFPSKWVKRGEGVYELQQDTAALLEGNEIEARDRLALAHQLELMALEYKEQPIDPAAIQRRPEHFDFDDRLLNTKPDYIDLDPHFGRWPVLWGAAVGGFLKELPPQVRERVLKGESVLVPSRTFSEKTQDLLFVFASASRRASVDPVTGQMTLESASDRRRRFAEESVGLFVQVDTENGTLHPVLQMRDGRGNTTGSAGPGALPIGFSQGLPHAQRSGLPAPVPFSDRDPRLPETPLTAEQRGELLAAEKQGVETLPAFLALLHRITNRPVAADFYSRSTDASRASVRNAYSRAVRSVGTLESFLDAFTHPLRYRWTREGDGLVFRNARWWIDDFEEVPLLIGRTLAADYKKQGHLKLRQLAMAADFNTTQLRSLGRLYLPERIAGLIGDLQSWLKLYTRLPSVQRGMLTCQSGMLIQQVPPEVVHSIDLGRELGLAVAALTPAELGRVRLRLLERARKPASGKNGSWELVVSTRTPNHPWRTLVFQQTGAQ